MNRLSIAEDFAKGTKVYGRLGTEHEKVAGVVVGFSGCQLSGCRGLRVWTRWPDGKLTKPCSEGLRREGDCLRIV